MRRLGHLSLSQKRAVFSHVYVVFVCIHVFFMCEHRYMCTCMHMEAQGGGQELSSVVLQQYSLREGLPFPHWQAVSCCTCRLPIPVSLVSQQSHLIGLSGEGTSDAGPHACMTND